MRFIIQTLVIALVAYVLERFVGWWGIAVAAALGGYFLRTRMNFLAGFVGVGLLWLLLALYTDAASANGLANRVADIFTIPKTLLVLVTVLVGGVVGGFAALTGARLHPKKRNSVYH